jgi:ELWxxDGT repeat protein
MNARSTVEKLESRRLLSGTGATEVVIGADRYFVNTDADHGAELWKSDTDGSNAVLVKDIFAGAASASPQWLFDFNGTLFFSANDGTTSGRELWKSDGTEPGTVRVAELYAHGASSSPHDFLIVNNHLFFLAKPSGSGDQLYVTDGTEGGTIKLFSPESIPHPPANMLVKDDILYFEGQIDANDQVERWQTNGTPGGTMVSSGSLLYPDGDLRVFSTSDDDAIDVSVAGGTLTVDINGDSETYAVADIESIYVSSLLGSDMITIGQDVTIGVTVDAGADDDSVIGGSGDDLLSGEDGNDTLNGEAGDDTLDGGDGDDLLSGDEGKDSLQTSDGNDSLNGAQVFGHLLKIDATSESDQVFLHRNARYPAWLDVSVNGDDFKYLLATIESVWVNANGGDDLVSFDGFALPSRIYGGDGSDVIYGSDGADRIIAGDGDDWVNAGAGNDVIYGEEGNDRLFGGDGRDYINGGPGVNLIRGGAEFDRILTHIGIDDYKGNRGDSIIDLIEL